MVNPNTVAQKHLAAISFSGPTSPAAMKPTPPGKPTQPGKQPAVPQSSKTKRLQMEQEKIKKNIEKQKQDDLKEYQKAQQDVQKAKDRAFQPLKVAAADPNDDPQELFRQVQPVLRPMGISSNLVDRNKTEIITGQNKGADSLYKILIRRDVEFTGDTIKRLNRGVDNFNNLKWDSAGMTLFVWAPYQSPVEEAAPGAL